MPGIRDIILSILDPKAAKWNEVSNQVPVDASPYTWQNARESVYGRGRDIELPAEETSPNLLQSLQKAGAGYKQLQNRIKK